MQPMVLTLAPINIMESMAAPWERSFTNYRRAGLLTLDEFYTVVLTKKPKEFLDVLAGQISGLLSRQSDRDYP
jgi:hypothetical protein